MHIHGDGYDSGRICNSWGKHSHSLGCKISYKDIIAVHRFNPEKRKWLEKQPIRVEDEIVAWSKQNSASIQVTMTYVTAHCKRFIELTHIWNVAVANLQASFGQTVRDAVDMQYSLHLTLTLKWWREWEAKHFFSTDLPFITRFSMHKFVCSHVLHPIWVCTL